jgi:hypothetical protein
MSAAEKLTPFQLHLKTGDTQRNDASRSSIDVASLFSSEEMVIQCILFNDIEPRKINNKLPASFK